MMRTILLVLAVLGLAAPALAWECTPDSSDPEVDAAGYYVDWDFCLPIDCELSIWIYEESNGIAGLQRADEVVDNTCGGEISGDTIVF